MKTVEKHSPTALQQVSSQSESIVLAVCGSMKFESREVKPVEEEESVRKTVEEEESILRKLVL